MLLCPGDFLCMGVTAAIAPARFGVGTAARIVLAWERLRAIFGREAVDGQARETDRNRQQ